MDYTIYYPTSLDEIDPKDDNVDVCIRFADGREYNFLFATPRNISTLIRDGGVPYLEPGLPFLFVEELTKTNIEVCIAAIAQDKAMLNLHGRNILNLLEGWEPKWDA